MSRARPRARSGPDRTKSEAARYRRAANEALRQVDHCIAYLRRIQKHQLAGRLAANRDWIERKLLREHPRRRARRRSPG